MKMAWPGLEWVSPWGRGEPLTCGGVEADPGQADRLVFGSESIASLDSPHVLECVGLIPMSKMFLRRNGGAEHPRERVSRKRLSLVAVPHPGHGWDRGSVSVSCVTCQRVSKGRLICPPGVVCVRGSYGWVVSSLVWLR